MESSAQTPLPALRRGLEMFPMEHQGKAMLALRDMEGLTDESVALSAQGMLLASFLDGNRAMAEVQSLFAKATGTFLQPAEIMNLVNQLEKSGFLETPEIEAKRHKIFEDFLASPVRRPAHQGIGYPENNLELASVLGAFFQDPKGPGKTIPAAPVSTVSPVGLFGPHIDFLRGGPAYAWAYQALAESPPPDVIVALGVAHASPNSPWVMTTKAYETPYGPMNVDLGLYESIKSHLWYDPRDDEWVHRGEHSLEFQAVWLKYLWRDKTPPWVPILCSSFDRFCPDKPPSTVESVEKAVAGIGEMLAERARKGQKILILAGVDLAHVGPAFGDDMTMGPDVEKKVEAEDRKSLEHVLTLESDPFYLSVVEGDHWRKVCGLSALYTSLRWIKALGNGSLPQGKLLTYGQAPDPRGGIVSFASGIFSKKL